MEFHTPTALTVLFGGYDTAASAATNDTWLYDGVTWTQATPSNSPPPLDTYALTQDLARGVLVLFGGVDSGNFPGSISDQTWEWDGTDWTQASPTTSPSSRFGAAMAYDPVRGVSVLFGGSTLSGGMADTWQYDGTTWTQVTTPTTPPARVNHPMVYDSARGTVVMFGGSSGANQLGDTWEFDGVDWATIDSARSPAVRTGATMVYDLLRGGTVLFGGRGPSPLGDTWELRSDQWHEYDLLTPPQSRVNHSSSYDLTRGQVVMFGGAGASSFSDTWEFGGASPAVASYGLGCAGTAGSPTLDALSRPALGTSFDLQLNSLPATAAFFAGSVGRASAAVPGTPCDLWIALPAVASVVLPQNGTATFSLPVPTTPALQGKVLFFQGLALDSSNALGLTFSNAVRAVMN